MKALMAMVAVLCCGHAAHAATDPTLERAQRLLRDAILIDGHNDLPWAIRGYEAAPGDLDAYDLRRPAPGQTDLARLRAGGVGGQFWSVFVPAGSGGGYARMQLEQIDLARRLIERYPDTLRFAATADQVRAAHRDGRIASLLGMEGGHVIENSLGALRAYYDLGVRYLTLTHNSHNDWADSATQNPPRHGGLTTFGEEVVREMNRLGMLVDLSHASADTALDALRVSQAPVIFSHSGARAVCDVPRNVPDDILRKLAANGGIVMAVFVAAFVDCEVAKIVVPAIAEYYRRTSSVTSDAERKRLRRQIVGSLEPPPTTIARVADHIEHIRKVAGVEHVGLGADFEGSEFWPQGLSDVSMYPSLFAELMRRGWTDRELRLLAGENLLRVLEQAEAVAARMQGSLPASLARP